VHRTVSLRGTLKPTRNLKCLWGGSEEAYELWEMDPVRNQKEVIGLSGFTSRSG